MAQFITLSSAQLGAIKASRDMSRDVRAEVKRSVLARVRETYAIPKVVKIKVGLESGHVKASASGRVLEIDPATGKWDGVLAGTPPVPRYRHVYVSIDGLLEWIANNPAALPAGLLELLEPMTRVDSVSTQFATWSNDSVSASLHLPDETALALQERATDAAAPSDHPDDWDDIEY